METPINRQILTGAAQGRNEMPLALEALEDTVLSGKQVRKGERVRVSKSEAKRVLALAPGVFRTVID